MSTYRYEELTAHITLDEGKVNALGSATLSQLDEYLSQASLDGASAVVLMGRPGMFSAGFDLTELRSGAEAQTHLRRTLIDLVLRLFEFERPVIIGCTGHAMAAGAALLLAADRRIGIDGPFKLGFNEVTMGASISAASVELARYRMPMPWFESLISGETFPPRIAQQAGLLDTVVETDIALADEAQRTADLLGSIAVEAFQTMRRAARGAVADRIRLERSRL